MRILALLLVASFCAAPLVRAAEDFEGRLQTALTAIKGKRSGTPAEFYAEVEKQGRGLLKDFPDQPAPYEMLAAAATAAEPEKARAILKEINTDKAPPQVKQMAAAMLAKLEAIGKPLEMKFTATDGREVSLASLKGKVVLVDFWATWCGPCVAELPNVLAAYEKLHPKGFEIVGISFDQDKAKLEKFVADKKMPWPQYFDGKGWQNAFGQKYGIESIPAMWLIAKDGNLADTNARENLTAKIEKLLAQ